MSIINEQYLFTAPDKTKLLLLVGRPDNVARLFIGAGNRLTETSVELFETYRDGGSMRIDTKDGYTLKVPAPNDVEGAAMWGPLKFERRKERVQLRSHDSASIDIFVSDGHATLIPGEEDELLDEEEE